MRTALWLLAIGLLVPASADAMDTNAAGRCVALGALSPDYQAKAEALLTAAAAQGYKALVMQRAREEFAYLAKHKHDDAAKQGWTFTAVRACGQF